MKKLILWFKTRRQASKLRRQARDFNRYSITVTWSDGLHKGELWMCPHCGKVSQGSNWNFMSGYDFEQCCWKTWKGFRSY